MTDVFISPTPDDTNTPVQRSVHIHTGLSSNHKRIHVNNELSTRDNHRAVYVNTESREKVLVNGKVYHGVEVTDDDGDHTYCEMTARHTYMNCNAVTTRATTLTNGDNKNSVQV